MNADAYFTVIIACIAAAWLVVHLSVRPRMSFIGEALLLTAVAAFVYLGAMGLSAITNGRAEPSETAPWLAAAAAVSVLSVRLFTARVLIFPPPRRKVRPAAPDPAPTPAPSVRPAVSDPPPAPPPPRGPVVFISYRRAGTADITGRIYDALIVHFGREGVFKDVDSIPLGVDFRQHLTAAVSQCRVVLAVIGKDWLAPGPLADSRDYVRIELTAALARNIPIVPLLVQGASMPSENALPEALRPLAWYNALPIRPDPDFHADMARLLRGIESHLNH